MNPPPRGASRPLAVGGAARCSLKSKGWLSLRHQRWQSHSLVCGFHAGVCTLFSSQRSIRGEVFCFFSVVLFRENLCSLSGKTSVRCYQYSMSQKYLQPYLQAVCSDHHVVMNCNCSVITQNSTQWSFKLSHSLRSLSVFHYCFFLLIIMVSARLRSTCSFYCNKTFLVKPVAHCHE